MACVIAKNFLAFSLVISLVNLRAMEQHGAGSARMKNSRDVGAASAESYDIAAAIRACSADGDLNIAVSHFGREASRCMEAGQKEKAATLGALGKVLDDERDRRKNDPAYAALPLQKRSPKLWRDYVAARCLIGQRPSEEELRQWNDAVYGLETLSSKRGAEPAAKRQRCDQQKDKNK